MCLATACGTQLSSGDSACCNSMAQNLTLGVMAAAPCCWPSVIPCIEMLTCKALTISMAQLIQLRSQIRMASNVCILAMAGCVRGKRSIAPGQLDNDQLPSSVRQRMANPGHNKGVGGGSCWLRPNACEVM